jgi:hypothetical protein
MKTFAIFLILTLAAPMAFVGCDRTVSSETKVKSTPDKTTVEKKTVTEDTNTGAVTETKEKKQISNNP